MYVALLEPEDTRGNIHGQVKALRELSELLGYKAKGTIDLTGVLRNITEEEIAYLRSRGHGPTLEKHLHPSPSSSRSTGQNGEGWSGTSAEARPPSLTIAG